jgi:hypothetical protein
VRRIERRDAIRCAGETTRRITWLRRPVACLYLGLAGYAALL